MVFSVIFLHERITLLMLAGGVLILLGVMIAEGTLGRREAIAQQERSCLFEKKKQSGILRCRGIHCHSLSGTEQP
jgi:hypothetical protein